MSLRLAIVVLNYRTAALTADCLASIAPAAARRAARTAGRRRARAAGRPHRPAHARRARRLDGEPLPPPQPGARTDPRRQHRSDHAAPAALGHAAAGHRPTDDRRLARLRLRADPQFHPARRRPARRGVLPVLKTSRRTIAAGSSRGCWRSPWYRPCCCTTTSPRPRQRRRPPRTASWSATAASSIADGRAERARRGRSTGGKAAAGGRVRGRAGIGWRVRGGPPAAAPRALRVWRARRAAAGGSRRGRAGRARGARARTQTRSTAAPRRSR
jgi:hypothetical protein